MLSAASMILRLSTVHENGLGHHNPFVFTSTTGYFHGSEARQVTGCFSLKTNKKQILRADYPETPSGRGSKVFK
jgi:hypothetical protein